MKDDQKTKVRLEPDPSMKDCMLMAAAILTSAVRIVQLGQFLKKLWDFFSGLAVIEGAGGGRRAPNRPTISPLYVPLPRRHAGGP